MAHSGVFLVLVEKVADFGSSNLSWGLWSWFREDQPFVSMFVIVKPLSLPLLKPSHGRGLDCKDQQKKRPACIGIQSRKVWYCWNVDICLDVISLTHFLCSCLIFPERIQAAGNCLHMKCLAWCCLGLMHPAVQHSWLKSLDLFVLHKSLLVR